MGYRDGVPIEMYVNALSHSQEDALVPDGPIIEPGLVFSNNNLGEIAPGTCFYITGIIMKQCER